MWILSLQGFSVGKIRDTFQSVVEHDLLLTWLTELFLALVIVAAFWGLSLLVRYLLTAWVPKLTRISRTDLDDRLLMRITPPVGLLTIFAGIYLAVRSLPLPDLAQVFISGGIFIVNVVIFTNIAYRAIDELLSWYAGRVEERTGTGMGKEILFLIRKLCTIFLACAALIVILKHFNYDIVSLVTAMGIGSLAIGLAAKDTLANMISGFTLMIDRPFRVGDRIQMVSGKTGDVLDIGLRSTKIRTPDNTLLIIPNAELCNSTVLNMAYPDLKTMGRITLGVAYDSDMEKVKQVMLETARGIEDVLPEPCPEVLFLSFGDSALNMSLMFWVGDYTKLFKTTDRINSALMHAFAANDIQIPFPTRKVLLEREE
jgi:MscS family membrane protein